MKRGLIPVYAFVLNSNDRIDILIATQSYICKYHLGEEIERYMEMYSSKDDTGSTRSFSTSLKSRNNWPIINDDGIIFAATLYKSIK